MPKGETDRGGLGEEIGSTSEVTNGHIGILQTRCGIQIPWKKSPRSGNVEERGNLSLSKGNSE